MGVDRATERAPMRLTKDEVESLGEEDPSLLRMVTYWHHLLTDWLAMDKQLADVQRILDEHECCCEMIEPCMRCQLRAVLG